MAQKDTPEVSQFREQLIGFNHKVRRLEKTRFFNTPPVNFSLDRVPAKIQSVTEEVDSQGKLSVKIEVEAQLSELKLHNFDRDDWEAFVLTYRMLTQNNDRYSIGRLAESYELAHYVFRNWFMYLRQETSSFLCTGSSLHIEGTAIPYRDILDVVIYGELAHSNKKKEATFAQWTRWPTHEQCLWLIFDHALRCAMKLLQHFRDVNVIALMAHFELLPDEETFRRLQHQGIIRTDAVFEQS